MEILRALGFQTKTCTMYKAQIAVGDISFVSQIQFLRIAEMCIIA